jgi:hypothetical protein
MTRLKMASSIWNRIPEGVQPRLAETPMYRLLRTGLARREELTRLRITPTPEFSFSVVVPARFDPWWLDYDPTVTRSSHEPITTRTFIEQIEPGDVVWDMGSQYGYFSQLAAELTGDPTLVHTFEMSPYKCVRIQRISDHRYGEDGLNVVEARVSDHESATDVTGDAYANQTAPPDFVKIDIEGAEVPGIRGLRETIEEHAPTLIVEMHPNKIHDHFEGTEADVLRTISEQYTDVRRCQAFRSLGAGWESWDGDRTPSGRTRGMDSAVDLDSYQLFCSK